MSTDPNDYQTTVPGSNAGVARWALPAVIAFGAAGMGVTGNLLWMDNQPKSTASTQTSSPTSSPQMPVPPMGTPPNGAGGMPNTPGATAPNSAPGADDDRQH